jgi:hypothetical protein
MSDHHSEAEQRGQVLYPPPGVPASADPEQRPRVSTGSPADARGGPDRGEPHQRRRRSSGYPTLRVDYQAGHPGPALHRDGCRPFDNQRMGFEGSTTINRKDWDLRWNVALEEGGPLVSKCVNIEVDVSAIKVSRPDRESHEVSAGV